MSTVTTPITSWDEFLALPDAEDGSHYELHDGEVCLVPPASPLHQYLQGLICELLTNAAKGVGRAKAEFAYRPASNLQFWIADIAYLTNEEWRVVMRRKEYLVFSPVLIVEILSPSNRAAEINRRRSVAFSGGTQEFWIVNPDSEIIEVSTIGGTATTFGRGDAIPIGCIPGAHLVVNEIFE